MATRVKLLDGTTGREEAFELDEDKILGRPKGFEIAALDPVTAQAIVLSHFVQNDNAGTIPQGAPVYCSGSTVNVDLAQANAASTSQVVGFVRDSAGISGPAGVGFIRTGGQVVIPAAQQTGTWTVNDRIYLDPATAGKLTNVVPTTAGQFIVPLGVVRNTPGGGSCTMYVQFGQILEIT